MSTQFCPSCLSQRFDQGRCMNCGFSRTEYRPAPTALPLDTMVGKYRIGVLKATSRQSQIYTGIDVASSAPVLIEEFLPAKMVGRMTDGLGVLPAQSDALGQQRFQQACMMFETSAQNRPLRKITVIRANNTVYNVFEPMMNVPADAQCEALADNPVYFRGPDNKPLMTINLLPIPPMPRERAYDPTGAAAKDFLVRTQMDTNTVKDQAGRKTIKEAKKNRLPVILAAIGVVVIALVCLLVILLTQKTVPTMEPEPTSAVATAAPTDNTPSDAESSGSGAPQNLNSADDKEHMATPTDQDPSKSIVIRKNDDSSDDDSTLVEEEPDNSSAGKVDAEEAPAAKDDEANNADSDKDKDDASAAEDDSENSDASKEGEEESEQAEDSQKNPSAADDAQKASEDTQAAQEDDLVSSELNSLQSIADKLRVEVKEDVTAYLKDNKRIELLKHDICKVVCVKEGKTENVFSASGKNGYDINVEVNDGDSARLRIYTMSGGKASIIDKVQVMMIVWEDVGRLKKGEYITVENIEDWARIQEKFHDKKDAVLKICDAKDGYYLIVIYKDKNKMELTEKFKIEKVRPNQADESNDGGTEPMTDDQEGDRESGRGSFTVTGDD